MRWTFALAACACLLLAGWAAPSASEEAVSTTAAVGRSMGGARVILIDVLFLRADALKKDGRPEEAAALYETIIELDPKNDAAAVHLIDIYVDDLLRREATLEGRMRWWRKARTLLLKALELNPGSAHLNYRAAMLIWLTPVTHEDLADLLAKEVEEPERLVLHHLRKAAQLADNIPTRGRFHLRDLSEISLEYAAQALDEDEPRIFAEALAAGYDLLKRRASTLRDMWHLADVGDRVFELRRDRFLEGGLLALAGVRDALRASDLQRAWDVVRHYEEMVGASNALGRLEVLLLHRLSDAVWQRLGGAERQAANLTLLARLVPRLSVKALRYRQHGVRAETLAVGDALLAKRIDELGDQAGALRAGLAAVRELAALLENETGFDGRQLPPIATRYEAAGGDPDVLAFLRWIIADGLLIPPP